MFFLFKHKLGVPRFKVLPLAKALFVCIIIIFGTSISSTPTALCETVEIGVANGDLNTFIRYFNRRGCGMEEDFLHLLKIKSPDICLLHEIDDCWVTFKFEGTGRTSTNWYADSVGLNFYEDWGPNRRMTGPVDGAWLSATEVNTNSDVGCHIDRAQFENIKYSVKLVAVTETPSSEDPWKPA